MTKMRKIICVLVAMAAIIAACSVVWNEVGRNRTIQAELRTVHMTEIEDGMNGEKLTGQELLGKKVKIGGVTLHRAVYYPQAETLCCFFQNADMNKDIYLAANRECNSMILAKEHGISRVLFEGVSVADLSAGVTVDKTDAQFEKSEIITFALT